MKSRLLTKFLSAAMAITLIGQPTTALAANSVSSATETTIQHRLELEVLCPPHQVFL